MHRHIHGQGEAGGAAIHHAAVQIIARCEGDCVQKEVEPAPFLRELRKDGLQLSRDPRIAGKQKLARGPGRFGIYAVAALSSASTSSSMVRCRFSIDSSSKRLRRSGPEAAAQPSLACAAARRLPT